MLTLNEATVLQLLGAWLWPFIRIGGFIMAAPVIGTRAVPLRVRMMLALALTGILAPVVAPAAIVDPMAAEGVLTGVHQLVIGASIGLVLRLAFVVFEFAGQLVAQQMGLGFAALVDPQTGAQVPVLAHLYTILATLLFFAIDAHLVLLELLADSFRLLPVGPTGLTAAGAGVVIEWSAELFGSALLFALPIVVALLAINLALGVMARAAPQLNIFAIGFPVMILVGVVLVSFTLDSIMGASVGIFDSAFDAARTVLGTR
jgi:flagellar biosynthetic protein FliR